MPSITAGIANFFNSIFSLIAGIFNTIFGAIQSLLSAVTRLFMDLFNMAEGVVGFVIGNIFILLILAALVFGGFCFLVIETTTMLMRVLGYRTFAGGQRVVIKEKKTL